MFENFFPSSRRIKKAERREALIKEIEGGRKKPNVESRKKEEPENPERRKFLGLTVGAVASLAGCAALNKLDVFSGDEKDKDKLAAVRERLETEDVEEVDLDFNPDEENADIVESGDALKEYLREKRGEIDSLFAFESTEPIKLTEELVNKVKNEYWKVYYEKGNLRTDYSSALKKMQPYVLKIAKSFKREMVPEEYLYLAIPESRWDFKADSGRARGPYQFTKSTGKLYALKINSKIDEREDPIKSGAACARCLKDNFIKTKGKYRLFPGDWNIALSGYNGGFIWKYLSKCNLENKEPTYEGFLNNLSQRATKIKEKVKKDSFINVRIIGGDNLWKLSQKFKVDMDEIKKVNGKKNNTILKGEVLKIPVKDVKQKESTYNELIAGYKENFNYAPKVNAVLELIEEGVV